ncbi:protein disulfide isomerase-like 1-3 isoform X2 [Euphorbia lathyris]|uniref:protein disulfide isomerase-like 1-3 isoform X2 n=1 Tax=Euphorbia lathyris TaxID=212925 RepID=UPI003313378C
MATPRILLLSFCTSILVLFTIFCFTPLSSSTLIAKALSIFDHNSDNTAVVSSASINPHHRQRSKEGKELHPRLEADEKDVVVLTEKNFTEFIAKNRYVMVKFYAPWCYWSKKLAPEYAAAATILKSRAVLAMVDCTQEAGLGRKLQIQGYPTMLFFVGGDEKIQYEFLLDRTRDSIANWVYQKMNNSVQNLTLLTSIDEAERVLASNSLIVLGFLHSLQGEESEVLAAVAKQNTDVNFYQTANAEVAKLFHIEPQIKCPALVILEIESGNHTHFVYDGQFTMSAIADFVSTYKLPSVITFTIEDAPMKQKTL